MGLGRDIVYGAAAAGSAPVWGFQLLRTGKWRTDWSGRFGRSPMKQDPHTARKTLLIHAVSVGEVNATRRLIELLGHAQPSLRIVLATTTNTGFARARQVYGGSHEVVRYPFDFSFAVNRFLNTVRPDLVALMELEIWPNFVEACAHRGIPVCTINGRLTHRSFRRYRWVRPWVRRSFAQLAATAVQTPEIAERFQAMGVPRERVHVLDTMKWDTAQVTDHVEGADTLAAEMGIDRNRALIVAGSTAPGEDKLLIDTCPSQAQLLIAPRKPEWFDQVIRYAPQAIRRSDPKPLRQPSERRIFLLDTIGELRKAYALADVVVVGRSFGRLYGSDMTEPIALNKPTIIGPQYSDFAQVMAALLKHDGIMVTSEPGRVAGQLLQDRERAAALAKRGREVILAHQGSAQKHADLLMKLLHRMQPD